MAQRGVFEVVVAQYGVAARSATMVNPDLVDNMAAYAAIWRFVCYKCGRNRALWTCA